MLKDVIPMNEKEVIQACLKKDRKAQKKLYEFYGPILYAIIKRYVRDHFTAEDILVESFMKIFTKLFKALLVIG